MVAVSKQVEAYDHILDLHVLCTHPAHSGRGCAGRLVKWSMQRAEEEGVECYVEAQGSSKPIFEKYGWGQEGELMNGDARWGTILVYKLLKKKRKGKDAGRNIKAKIVVF